VSGETLRAPRQQLRQFAPQPSIYSRISENFSNPLFNARLSARVLFLARVIFKDPNAVHS
jgi:hypothetical protein